MSVCCHVMNIKLVSGALKMQDKTLQDRTMTGKRSTMPE